MTRNAAALIAVGTALLLSACETDAYAPTGVYADVDYAGYYDGYYGPFYGGYWGPGGYFYYSDRGGHRFHQDTGHHFRRDAVPGYRPIQGHAPASHTGGRRHSH